jgi:chromosomal replication initiator protein
MTEGEYVAIDQSLSAQWARIRGRLRAEYGEAAYRSWLKPLTLCAYENGRVQISVPTRFMRDWVGSQYGDRLARLWKAENDKVTDVEIVLVANQSAGNAGTAGARSIGATTAASAFTGPDNEIGAPLDPRFTFSNFIVGKPNELAFAAARRVAEANAVPFNPLFLYGGVGLGKTHLMHAIAWHLRETRPDRRVIYLSAEKFMYQFIRALRYKDTVAFKEQFRSVDVLMIDDVQFIAGKDSTQEEFFHTFNALVDQNHQVIISADKSPNDLEGMEDRMKSRLGWGLVADIHPTTYELRLGIMQAKAEQLEVSIPQKVLEYLAHKITSNVRELEGALNRIGAYAKLVGRPVTLENTQDVLHDILRANDRRVTIEEIQKRVAEHYNIRLSEMYSARRARAVARPRQVAMYLSKQLTARSLPEIGRKFGGRDHTTVMHACDKISALMKERSQIYNDVMTLEKKVRSEAQAGDY